MYAFSVFSMWLLWRCFYHIFQLHDVTQVSIWLANMPMLIASLIGLIALPYGINKGSSTFSDIANMMTAAKTGNSGGVQTALSSVVNPSVPSAPPIPPPLVGSPGIKG
jgi:hypothetical protein